MFEEETYYYAEVSGKSEDEDEKFEELDLDTMTEDVSEYELPEEKDPYKGNMQREIFFIFYEITTWPLVFTP